MDYMTLQRRRKAKGCTVNKTENRGSGGSKYHCLASLKAQTWQTLRGSHAAQIEQSMRATAVAPALLREQV